LAFAKQGARVIAADIRLEAVEETASLCEVGSGSIVARELDVTEAESAAKLMKSVVDEFGAIDILVNNAGVGHVGTVQTTNVADFERLFQINVKGVFLCTQAAIMHMLAKGKGVILNMASIASLIGVKDRFAYSMTKGAVLTMTYSTAIDYVSKGIRCNAVCPSRVHTPFVDGFLKRDYPGREQEMFEQLSRYQPIGRMCKPEEVGALAVYLCSDEASFITGVAYPIDGGVLVQ
jgi:NAD(P)-dependent dehydrogenase (short-subunit alcohol dehydrogenase family)